MMNNWVNRQNKRHNNLYKEDGRTYLKDDMISWLDSLLFQGSERLNRRLYKISKRRGKKTDKIRSDELPESITLFLASLDDE